MKFAIGDDVGQVKGAHSLTLLSAAHQSINTDKPKLTDLTAQ